MISYYILLYSELPFDFYRRKMRKVFYRYIVLILLVFLCISSLSSCSDPSRELKTGDSKESFVSSDEDIPDYIDADAFAKRSYELYFLLSQKSFDSPEQMSVSALVQFAFCHLFYTDLTDMPTTGIKIRNAKLEDIKTELIKHFGELDIDLTQADLYNKAHERFEMWEPHYGTEIHYDTVVKAIGNDNYTITTVFYTDKGKSEVLGRTVMTVHDNGGIVYITKLE